MFLDPDNVQTVSTLRLFLDLFPLFSMVVRPRSMGTVLNPGILPLLQITCRLTFWLPLHHQSSSGKVFNIACDHQISLLEIIADLNALTNETLEPVFNPTRLGDVLHSRADIDAGEKCLWLSTSCRI